MKGYAVLAALMTLLLLLLPLPALPRQAQATQSSPSSEPSTSTTTTTPAEQSPPETTKAPEENKAVFRILVGEDVVELEEREFLIRTLAFEMPTSYHPEALKAQAVAAYTYHARRREAQQKSADPALKGAHFASPDATFPGNYSPEALQKRWGEQYTANLNKLSSAVDAVLGKSIRHEGSLIDACYFAISSGTTEAAATLWGNAIPYLQPVASPGDTLSPNYESVVTFTPEELSTKLKEKKLCSPTGDAVTWLGEATLSPSGTVTALPIAGQTLTGMALRDALALRSACFSVVYSEGLFRFTVRGYGHGVGMSQYGADYLARQGYTYEEILKYYYTGVTIA